MTTILEKIQEKECRIEALRAQIAKLQADVTILEDAARILSEDEGDNRFAGQSDGKRSAA
jgi:chorismate-pyruvate lyase